MREDSKFWLFKILLLSFLLFLLPSFSFAKEEINEKYLISEERITEKDPSKSKDETIEENSFINDDINDNDNIKSQVEIPCDLLKEKEDEKFEEKLKEEEEKEEKDLPNEKDIELNKEDLEGKKLFETLEKEKTSPYLFLQKDSFSCGPSALTTYIALIEDIKDEKEKQSLFEKIKSQIELDEKEGTSLLF